MEVVSKASLLEFLSRRRYSLIHIDAKWDGGKDVVQRQLLLIEPHLAATVSFGYVDCDLEQDFARDISLMNVPSVAYYNEVTLKALVIGGRQDIRGNIRRLMPGKRLINQTYSATVPDPQSNLTFKRKSDTAI